MAWFKFCLRNSALLAVAATQALALSYCPREPKSSGLKETSRADF